MSADPRDARGLTRLLWPVAVLSLGLVMVIPPWVHPQGMRVLKPVVLLAFVFWFPGAFVALTFIVDGLLAQQITGLLPRRNLVLTGPVIAFIGWLPGMHHVHATWGRLGNIHDEPLGVNMLLSCGLAAGLALVSSACPAASRACWPLAIFGASLINAAFPVMLYVGF